MSSSPRNGAFSHTPDRDLSPSGEDTLRLIASLPAPEGLADRVQDGLRHAPPTARVLDWRGPVRPSGGWMQSTMARGAAAAAIVCVVAGGGWRIYSKRAAGARGQSAGDSSAGGAGRRRILPGRGKARSADAGRSGADPSSGRQHGTESCRQGAGVFAAATGRPAAAKKSAARPSAARPVAIPMP